MPAGISTEVSWLVSRALPIAAVVLASGCDVRALQKHELMGGSDAATSDTRPDGGGDVWRRMLSGSVTDACTGRGIAARVGIAGRRQCSAAMKGSYYFDILPEGDLALVAFKEGYRLFEVAVLITAEGTIQDIVLAPDTARGCAAPLPVDVACECTIPGCI
jgi:hypothetical protein